MMFHDVSCVILYYIFKFTKLRVKKFSVLKQAEQEQNYYDIKLKINLIITMLKQASVFSPQIL